MLIQKKNEPPFKKNKHTHTLFLAILLQADFWLFFTETAVSLHLGFIWFLEDMNALIPLLLCKPELYINQDSQKLAGTDRI